MNDIPDAPAPVEPAKEEVEEIAPTPDPPTPDKADMPEWAKKIVDKVDALAEQVTAMTPVPPPVDEVIENDDAPVPLPWTHKGFGGPKHSHGDDD